MHLPFPFISIYLYLIICIYITCIGIYVCVYIIISSLKTTLITEHWLQTTSVTETLHYMSTSIATSPKGRIPEWLRLEGTLEGHLVHRPA